MATPLAKMALPGPGDDARAAFDLVRAEVPDLLDGTGTPIAKLWDFLLQTGFLYREKLGPMDAAASQSTWRTLLGTPNDTSRTCLLARDGDLRAHVAGVRVYRRSWMLQHLAARPDPRTPITHGRTISLAMIRLLEQTPDVDWAKVWYRPTNRFPLRLYGSFAAGVRDLELSEQTTYDYLVCPTEHPHAQAPADETLQVAPAQASDGPRIAAFFAALSSGAARWSDDLSPDVLSLGQVERAYAALGLERRRELLTVRRDGALVGFAMLELSSPGLNLSELTSSFRIFSLVADEGAKAALVTAAHRRYAVLGRRRSVALADPRDRPLYERLGFTWTKQYTCWTWHRSLFAPFCEHVRTFAP
jgi:hypothetical protein